jgi:hypothetical protein
LREAKSYFCFISSYEYVHEQLRKPLFVGWKKRMKIRVRELIQKLNSVEELIQKLNPVENGGGER